VWWRGNLTEAPWQIGYSTLPFVTINEASIVIGTFADIYFIRVVIPIILDLTRRIAYSFVDTVLFSHETVTSLARPREREASPRRSKLSFSLCFSDNDYE
jgi:hypothetical protein